MSNGTLRGRLGVPSLYCVVAVVVALCSASVVAVSAGSPPGRGLGELGVSVEPAAGVDISPWLVYELDPGAVRNDDIVVANDSSEARQIDLYPADAATGPSGVFSSGLEGMTPHLLGAWIRMNAAHFDLPAHSQRHVHLVLSVPPLAEPGEYEASILAQFQTASDQKVQIVHRIGLRVYLTVEGPVTEAGAITSVAVNSWWERGWPSDPALVLTRFANTGRVHLNLNGAVSAGGTSVRFADPGPVVVPRNSTTNLFTSWRSHPWFGWQRLTVSSQFANHSRHSASASLEIFYLPWKLLLLVVALAVLALYAGRLVWRWLRASRTVSVSVDGVSMRMAVVAPADYPVELPPPPAGRQTVVVGMRVHNGGRKPFRFSPQRLQLLDRENRAASPDRTATEALPNPQADLVAPGSGEVFALAFHLPEATSPRAAIYSMPAGRLMIEVLQWR